MDVPAFLHSVTVVDIIGQNQKVISHAHTDTCEAVFKTLVDNHISSVPLHDGTKVIAFVDMFDVLQAFVDQVDVVSPPVWKIAGVSGRNPFVTIQKSAPIIEVLRLMCITAPKSHRLAVFDGEEFYSILTQSQIVRWLRPHLEKFDFATLSLRTKRVGSTKVISVPETKKISDAIQIILENQISGVAVVNADGKLVGNFSGSDFSKFGKQPEASQLKQQTLKSFLDLPLHDFIKTKNPADYPVTITDHGTLTEVVAKLVDSGIHHLYVVKEDGAPQAVVSHIDILQLFWDHILIE